MVNTVYIFQHSYLFINFVTNDIATIGFVASHTSGFCSLITILEFTFLPAPVVAVEL